MPNSDKSELEIEVSQLVRNLFKYFKKVEKLKKANAGLRRELRTIKDELIEIREGLMEYRKIEDGED